MGSKKNNATGAAPPAKEKRLDARPGAAALLLAWYDRHRRRLPWRAEPGRTADPYGVWLSEIMLQQTTVAAVKPYYDRFLALWPDVHALAGAPVEEVMKAWAGLGYYSRARNLHACAQAIVDKHSGRFPPAEDALRSLPGIGPYTAAAIAAIAFGQRAVVVDGNVERVVSRLYRIATPLPAAKPEIRTRTGEMTPMERAGDFAQAMMDLGATICTPKSPACAICPLTALCAARASGDQAAYPRKAPKAERPRRAGNAFYLQREDGMALVRRRPPKGLLGGMLEFPGSDWTAQPPASGAGAPVPADWIAAHATVEHVFTHFSLTLDVRAAQTRAETLAPEGCFWIAERELEGEALPSVMRKVMEAGQSLLDRPLSPAAQAAPARARSRR